MKKVQTIADEQILAIPVYECGEVLVNVKDQNRISYGPPPETPLTANDYTKIRQTVYEKLCRAQDALPNGWRLRLYEGFRSLQVQALLFNEQREHLGKQGYKSEEELYKATCRLVSPVILPDGTENIPPHNTGAAVDIEIIDAQGDLVDCGMAAKDWLTVDPEICETFSKEISGRAQENRQILLEVMIAQGFVNYPREWWHFSYGDRLWAYLHNKKQTLYAGLNP